MILPQREIIKAHSKRKQWFLDRVGKTVFRPPTKCQCDSCKNGHLNGVLISDKDHALYLHSVEGELGLRYSDKAFEI